MYPDEAGRQPSERLEKLEQEEDQQWLVNGYGCSCWTLETVAFSTPCQNLLGHQRKTFVPSLCCKLLV